MKKSEFRALKFFSRNFFSGISCPVDKWNVLAEGRGIVRIWAAKCDTEESGGPENVGEAEDKDEDCRLVPFVTNQAHGDLEKEV